jgi:LuxR family maltose regulon positive regulatory protein
MPRGAQRVDLPSRGPPGEPILATKLHIPPARPNLVARPRLLERLDQGVATRLTLLSAPAGFGKTTLLSAWLARFPSSVPWVSLDAGDNDPVHFLHYLIAALRTIEPEVGEGARRVLRSPQPPSIESILTMLINELCMLAEGVVAVLDDYHVIDTPAIHDIIAFLLEHLPLRMHLVIATRVDPPLPLAGLRARGHLSEIREADLRFTTEETTVFLNQTMGLRLSAEDIAALEARTEGWVAGLQLAGLSLHGLARGDIASFIEAFAGSHRYIVDYLVEEVLSRQPETVQSFLLQTSILDRMSGSLCDALTQRADGQAMLERLEKANLFLVPLDDQRRWYRYHHLLADLMRQQLQTSEPGFVPELHRRASQWHEQNGNTDESIQHALAAKDWMRAASLMDESSYAAWLDGEIVKLQGWVKALPESVSLTYPRLGIYYAWAAVLTGRYEESEKVLAQTESAIQDNPVLQVDWLAVQVFLSRAKGQQARAIELAQKALKLPKTGDLVSRGLLMLSLTVAYWDVGKIQETVTAAREAVRLAEQAGNWHARAIMLSFLGLAQAALGNLRLAFEIYQQAIREQPGVPNWTGGGFAQACLSALYYEWDELDRAIEYARAGLEYSRLTGHSEIQMNCHRQLAFIFQALGDVQGVQEVLDQAARVILKHPLPRLWGPEHVQIALAREDLPSALHWIEQVQGEYGASIHYPALPLERAKLALAQGDRTGAAVILAERYQVATQAGIRYAQIEIRILQALAASDDEQALVYLAEALTTAQSEGYVRIFVDQGKALVPLLRRAAHRGIAPGYVARLLSAMADSFGAPPSLAQPLIEPLSEREIEVLQLLAAGKSNQAIAAELVLSVGTVKAHNSNIYGKLGVRSRTQAVARARKLNLLQDLGTSDGAPS